MLNLRDHDVQYRATRVGEPKYRPPDRHGKPDFERPLAPQLVRLCQILEEHFLDRWAYRAEVRDKLASIDLSAHNGVRDPAFEPQLAEGDAPGTDYVPNYWGHTAYSILLRNATVLERAGVLQRRSGVKPRIGELLGRPLSDREIVISGSPWTLLEAQLELALTLGAHGALIVDRGSISPSLGVMVVEDGELAAQWLSRSRLRNLSEKEFRLSDLGRAPGTLAKARMKF